MIGSPVPEGWPEFPEAPNASTGVLVSLGFEHIADQEDQAVGTVWEWSWSRPRVE